MNKLKESILKQIRQIQESVEDLMLLQDGLTDLAIELHNENIKLKQELKRR